MDMKCPNCGNEIGEERKCSQCGTTINSAKTKANDFEPIQGEESTLKKKSKGPFILVAIVLVMVALAAYYVQVINAPRYIFDQKISQVFANSEEIPEYNTMKTNGALEITINSDAQEAEEIKELFNDMKFSFCTELDKSAQEEVVNFQMSKANQTLLDANMKLEAETQNLYINLGELFDKTIKMDMSEVSDETFEIVDSNITTFAQKINEKKAYLIFQKEIKAQLKDEYFSSEKMTLDGESVTKNTIRLSAKECMDMVRTICENLRDNKDFIDCFEEGEEVKNSFQEIIDKINELDTDGADDAYLQLDLFTTGFKKTIQKMELSITDDYTNMAIQLKKVEDREYQYELLEDEESIMNGTIKIQGEKDDFVVEVSAIAEEVESIVKVSGNVTYNEALRDFDMKNVVNSEDLTTEDIYTLLGNFAESDLYKMIEKFDQPAMLDHSDDDLEEDNLKNQSTSSSQAKLPENVLTTYGDQEIKFNIPTGFENYSSDSEYYKLFQKKVGNGRVNADVSTTYKKLDQYMEDVKGKVDYYKDEQYYENVNISDEEELDVGGNKFKKIIITYDSKLAQKNYKQLYIAHQIDEENLYLVEVDGPSELIDEREIEPFLTLEK